LLLKNFVRKQLLLVAVAEKERVVTSIKHIESLKCVATPTFHIRTWLACCTCDVDADSTLTLFQANPPSSWSRGDVQSLLLSVEHVTTSIEIHAFLFPQFLRILSILKARSEVGDGTWLKAPRPSFHDFHDRLNREETEKQAKLLLSTNASELSLEIDRAVGRIACSSRKVFVNNAMLDWI
jgi:hypothetical protein